MGRLPAGITFGTVLNAGVLTVADLFLAALARLGGIGADLAVVSVARLLWDPSLGGRYHEPTYEDAWRDLFVSAGGVAFFFAALVLVSPREAQR